MSNNSNFPNVEPPPHPATGQPNVPETNSPLNVLTPDYQQPVSTDSQAQPTNLQTIPPNQPVEVSLNKSSLPKKGIPKVLIILLVVMLAIFSILGIALLFKNRNVSGPLVGTKGEITWWGIENDESVVAPLIDKYQKDNPNVKITYIKQSEKDYRERLTNALASGEGPDIYEIHNSWIPMFIKQLSPMPVSVMNETDYRKTFYPVVSDNFVTKGGILAIPLEYDAVTLFYNQDIFNAAAATPPQTWDDLTPLAKKLTRRSQNDTVVLQAGIALGLTENIDYWPEIIGAMLLQNGANLNKPDSKFAEPVINYYLEFSKKDGTWDSAQPHSVSAFAKGKLAMYLGPTKSASDIISENPSLRFKTSIIPQLAKNKPTDPNFTYATYWAQGVWKRSKNADLAWSFLKIMSEQSSLQEMNTQRKSKNILEKAYPRPDMSQLQKEDSLLGSLITLAPEAKSWYLADKTFDGPTGINSQMNKIFSDVIASAKETGDLKRIIESWPTQISAVLTKYQTK